MVELLPLFSLTRSPEASWRQPRAQLMPHIHLNQDRTPGLMTVSHFLQHQMQVFCAQFDVVMTVMITDVMSHPR